MIREQLTRDIGDSSRVRPRLLADGHEILTSLALVGRRDPLDDQVVDDVQELATGLRRRRPAVRAVTVVRRDRLATVPTLLPAARSLVGLLDDAGGLEDVVVDVLGGEVDVLVPHVRIHRPVGAVLDLLLRVALASHPGDCGVLEVVRVDRLLDAGVGGDPLETSGDSAGRHPAVVLGVVGVEVPAELVEQRDVVLVATGMRAAVDVAADRRLRVDQRIVFDRGILQSDRVIVRAVRRLLTIEVDVADAERTQHPDAAGRVGEKLDDRHVALPVGRVQERRDVVLVEHVVRVDGAILVVGAVDLEVLGPLAAAVVEEHPEDLDVRLAGRHAHDAVAAPLRVRPHLREIGVRVVDILELDEWFVAALGALPEARGVAHERRDGVRSGAPVDEFQDRVAVGFGYSVGVLQALSFLAESRSVSPGVVGRHDSHDQAALYKAGLGKMVPYTLEAYILCVGKYCGVEEAASPPGRHYHGKYPPSHTGSAAGGRIPSCSAGTSVTPPTSEGFTAGTGVVAQ